MAAQALIPIAMQVGATLIEKILAKKIGAENAELASSVIRDIADRAGVTPDQLETLAVDDPVTVGEAMISAERSPEVARLYAKGLEGQFELLQAERADPAWMRAWRPLGMYVIGFLWVWAIVIVHVANAFFRIALPPPDLWVLFQLTALYLTLYMGGHTFKDFVSKKWSAK